LDTRTLRYDWFLRDDGTKCEVREAYLSEEGLFEHVADVRDARDKLFRDFADDHRMTVYGTPSPRFLELAKAHGAAVRWFSCGSRGSRGLSRHHGLNRRPRRLARPNHRTTAARDSCQKADRYVSAVLAAVGVRPYDTAKVETELWLNPWADADRTTRC
jgi:hypothetical protein